MRISQKFVKFHQEITQSVPYMLIPANTVRLKLESSQTTQIQTGLADWMPKFSLYINPSTHLEQVTTNINMAYNLFHPIIQGLKMQLKNNKAIALLGEDYATIGIHKDKVRRGRIPKPAYAPENRIESQHHLRTNIYTCNTEPGHDSERKLPDDVEKIGRKLAITGSKTEIPEAEMYHNLETIGFSRYVLSSNEEDVGKCGWIITWYINPRGEVGPESNPRSFFII